MTNAATFLSILVINKFPRDIVEPPDVSSNIVH